MRRLLLTSALAISALSLGGCGESIDSGNVGLYKTWGKLDPEPLEPGFHFINPFSGTIIELPASTQRWTDGMDVYTKDNQKISVVFTVTFRPVKAAIPDLYVKAGSEDYAKAFLPQIITSQVKDAFGQYDSSQIVTGRERIQQDIINRLRPRFAATKIPLEDFALTDIKFSKEFEDAVERKITAVQNAQAEQNRTVQIREQGEQKKIAAAAEAEATKLQAQALENNPKIVQFEWVRKWNGQMPQVVYCSSNTPCVQAGGQ